MKWWTLQITAHFFTTEGTEGWRFGLGVLCIAFVGLVVSLGILRNRGIKCAIIKL